MWLSKTVVLILLKIAVLLSYYRIFIFLKNISIYYVNWKINYGKNKGYMKQTEKEVMILQYPVVLKLLVRENKNTTTRSR